MPTYVIDLGEIAQDAVGGILTDTDTINQTYDDGTPSISAVVTTQQSITSDTSGIKLSGDSATPGNTKYYGTDGAGTKGWNDLTESTQDAVGNILTDTATINFTYNDGVPSIIADVITQQSITSDASGIKLSGDSASPGNTKYYGTDGAGAKGWNDLVESAQDSVGNILTDTATINFTYNDGVPSIVADVITQQSITSDASGIKLSGDSASPGNTKLYGTNGSGTKGWYDQSSAIPSGVVQQYAGTTTPTGWLACDGSAISRATYANLFTAIGTTWGVGDGSTTFNLPDARGKTAISDGTGSGLTARTVGNTGGAETHALSVGELAVHGHTPAGDAVYRYTGTGTDGWNWSVSGGGNMQATIGITIPTAGSGTAHNNMQPWLCLRYIIKT